MRAPSSNFSEDDFRKKWDSMVDYLATMRDLNIKAPGSMTRQKGSYRMDDSGEPMCDDCGIIPVRNYGMICMGCKIDHAQSLRGDE